MGRERVADVREDARIEQIDLSATVLLGRRPDDLERRRQWSRSGRSKQEGADVRHRDEVVTAAVADAGERVLRHAAPDGLPRRRGRSRMALPRRSTRTTTPGGEGSTTISWATATSWRASIRRSGRRNSQKKTKPNSMGHFHALHTRVY